MKDLTLHGKEELSLHVFNDEYFYNERKDRPYLMALIAEEFHYTPEHMAVLVKDLDEEEAA
jgi:hypothetical protein